MNDYDINEAYFGQLQKEQGRKTPAKVVTEDVEQLDESLIDILKYVNKLNWDSNPTLDPANKKLAQKKASELMMHIKEAEKRMKELEPLVGWALAPGFSKLINKVVKDTI